MAVRVLDKDGGGNFADIIKAYEYLIKAKTLGVNIKAVNCSFGSEGKSTILDSIINRAGENGIITIAAAGNESQSNDVNEIMPANADSQYVISVASVDEDGGLASYSNYGGNSVDIAAPGSNINKATVTAKDIKKASELGATTVTLGAKVKKVKKNAFKGTNINTIVVKTKKLKAKSVKGSLKGSKVKTVKVEIGSKKVNKKFVKKYKKFFTKKNAGKKAKVK